MEQISKVDRLKNPTKLKLYMAANGISNNDLYDMIKESYPYSPVTQDTLSRIKTGKRQDYLLSTLYKICKVTGLSPNEVLDWEPKTK